MLADADIIEYVNKNEDVYACAANNLTKHHAALIKLIEKRLQRSYPFTSAGVGRIGCFVPFLPMSSTTEDDDGSGNLLRHEIMTMAKMLIEREQENVLLGDNLLQLKQFLPPSETHDGTACCESDQS